MDLSGSTGDSLKNRFLSAIPISFLLGSAAVLFLQPHLHFHNPRIQYGVSYLPEALALTALFAAIAGLLWVVFSGSTSLEAKPTSYYLAALALAFCLCWLPVLLKGRFVQDDWMLLAGAEIRKIIYLHPSYAWFSLDTVDGNFRPLGTTLYFAWMLKSFGMNAFAFLCGNFIVNLSGSIVALFIVRELGYSKPAGAAASLLYMTRGLNYTVNAWTCALGDGIVILLGGLVVLGILRANRRRGASALALHTLSWILFCIALFAKQSSFSIPLIVALLILLQPGQTELASLRRRVACAIPALIAYSIPVAIVFFHAKSLLREGTPYPLSLSLESFTKWLSYISWYFVCIQFPGRYRLLNLLTEVVGFAILAGLAIFVSRVPRALGKRRRDIGFLLLAALAAIAPYSLLPTRAAAYYGAMSAFWISIALGIALTRFGGAADRSPAARNACFALYLIVIAGFLDIRLKQTGLIPSGGYIWGTYGMDVEKNAYNHLAAILAKSPAQDTLVLVNFPVNGRYFTSMALFADPGLRRILVYDTGTKAWLGNGLAGLRPKDEFDALNDTQAYNWTVPLDSAEANRVTARSQTIWIEYDGGKMSRVTP